MYGVDDGAGFHASGWDLSDDDSRSLGVSYAVSLSEVGEADSPKMLTHTRAKQELETTLDEVGLPAVKSLVSGAYQKKLENL